MQEIDLICLGRMDNSDGTLESENRVYAVGGICPTIATTNPPKVLEKDERLCKDKTSN